MKKVVSRDGHRRYMYNKVSSQKDDYVFDDLDMHSKEAVRYNEPFAIHRPFVMEESC